MSERLFTLDEALAVLPEAARLLLEIQDIKEELDQRGRELERLLSATEGNGHLADDIAAGRAAVHAVAEELERAFRRMDALGVELKGIETGLLDFPSLRDGRIVYLCWRQGEEGIGFWHDIDTGFAGRQPL